MPLFSGEQKKSNRRNLTMMIRLTMELNQSYIHFRSADRLLTHEQQLLDMLRPDTPVVSVERHQEFLQLMENEPIVRRVNLPLAFEVPQMDTSQVPQVIELPDPPQSGAPIVGIVDGGVADMPALSSWRCGGTDPVVPADRDPAHGTFIAGLVAGGRTLNPHIATTLEPSGCRYFDIPLLPRRELFSRYYGLVNEFFEQLEEEVIRAKSEANVRIFNVSLGVSDMSRAVEYSIYAQTLDDIAAEHDVLFVVSAGNLSGTYERPPWPNDGDEAVRQLARNPAADERIIAPSEHLLGLSVGALNPPGIPIHGANLPTTYTRRGPGVGGVLKPELTHYGGVSSPTDGRSGLFSFDSNNTVVENSGTSFATPLVASTLATIDHRLEGTIPRETLVALLIHRAQRCDAMDHPALRYVVRDFVGFGMAPPADECLSDMPDSITLVFSESLASNKELQFTFSWPRSLVTSAGKCRGQVDLTLVFTPPIDSRFGAECIRTQLEAYLQQIENDPITGVEKPISRLKHFDNFGSIHSNFATERDLLTAGHKWAPVKRYKLKMPKGCGTSSDWRLVLRSSSRDEDINPEDMVPFTIVMTIFDLEQAAPVYDEVRNEISSRGLNLEDITVAHRVRPRN